MSTNRYGPPPLKGSIGFRESVDLYGNGMSGLGETQSPGYAGGPGNTIYDAHRSGRFSIFDIKAKQPEVFKKLQELMSNIQDVIALRDQINATGVKTAIKDAEKSIGRPPIDEILRWAIDTKAEVQAAGELKTPPDISADTDNAWKRINSFLVPIGETMFSLQRPLRELPGILDKALNAATAGASQSAPVYGAPAPSQAAPVASAPDTFNADNDKVDAAIASAYAKVDAGNFRGAFTDLSTAMRYANKVGRASEIQDVAGYVQQTARDVEAKAAADAARESSKAESDAMKAEQAALKAEQMAAANAAQDKIDGALSRAADLAMSGNFRGAVAVLSTVSSLARQVGRESDIQLAVADAQQQAEEANAQKVKDAANAKVDAAIQQAHNYADSGSFQVAISILNNAMGAAQLADRSGDIQTDIIAIQSARKAAEVVVPPQAPVSLPQSGQGLQYGQSPGDFGYGQAPAMRDPSGNNWGIDPGILPPGGGGSGGGGTADILAQILQALRGSGSMASSIPGDGSYQQIAPRPAMRSSGYEDATFSGGNESF